MALIATQTFSAAGAVPSFTAAAASQTFRNSGATKLHVKNGSGASITVTLDSPGTCSFGVAANAAHDVAITVDAGSEKIISHLAKDRFNDANGEVAIAWSATTSVTVAVYE